VSERTATLDVSAAIALFTTAAHHGAAFEAARAHGERLRLAALDALASGDERARTIDATLRAHESETLVLALVRGTQLAGDRAFGDDAPTIAAALSAGERRSADALAVATAIAIGCELALRMHRALASTRFEREWNGVTVAGIVGAVAAAARLWGLDASAARHALGIVATEAAGTGATRGTPAAALACGKAASDALEAVALAAAGFTAASASLEGRRGLAAVMAERFDAAAFVDALGARWTVTEA
jgi:hypothetical protein